MAQNVTATTVTVKGINNFRNVAGITNSQGKTLKDSLIYRSADLSALKPKRFSAFTNLGIKTVIDLRTDAEVAQKPDVIPPGVQYLRLAAFEDKGDQLNQARTLVLKGKVNSTDANNRMLAFYRGYVTEKPDVIKTIIHQVLDSDAPVLYHCTAGKDRTGIITALVLKVLRFDDSVIFNEYLTSNNQRKNLINKRLRKTNNFHFIFPKMDIGVLEKLSWIETAYLQAAFDEIESKYGSVDNYIHTVLGISEAKRQVYIDRFTY